jgi:hypothetical protein
MRVFSGMLEQLEFRVKPTSERTRMPPVRASYWNYYKSSKFEEYQRRFSTHINTLTLLSSEMNL